MGEVYARVYRRRALVALAWVNVLLWVLMVVAAIAVHGPAQIYFAFIAVMYTPLTWFYFNLGVRVEPYGVKVLAGFKRTSVRWQEIDRFELRPSERGDGLAGKVVLKDGQAIGISIGARPGRAKALGEAQALIDGLNRLLAEARLTNR
jgi:hypothetical protein